MRHAACVQLCMQSIPCRIFWILMCDAHDTWRVAIMMHARCFSLCLIRHSEFRAMSSIDLWLILIYIMYCNLANWGRIDRSCKVFTVYSNILWSILANTFQMNTFRNIFRRILSKRILWEYYFSEYLACEYEYFLQKYSKKYSNTWATIEPCCWVNSWIIC